MNLETKPIHTPRGPSSGLSRGPDGWVLTSEGAAVRVEEKLAVIADVHLGYEWARASKGDMVPAHSLDESIAKLGRLLDRGPIETLVVAGDLVESSRPCERTARDVQALTNWLKDRGVNLVRIKGNHDERGIELVDELSVAGWTIAHGHKKKKPAGRFIMGHHHPLFRACGVASPCFVVGERMIVLPAFSPNAAGVNVLSGYLSDATDIRALRCIAAIDQEIRDFGMLSGLIEQIYGPGQGERKTRRRRSVG